jgi:MFS family permease
MSPIPSTRVALRRRLVDATGSPGRLRIVAIFAAVLVLDSADKASLGAVAPSLESSLGIGDTQLGLLVTASTAVAAVATVPAGMLVDRFNRVRLLSAALVVWSVALAAGGFAGSWTTLLATRMAVGVIGAVAGPAIASLVGDYFRPGERGHIYGLILSGELVGSSIGFLVSGNVAAALSWREAYWLVAALGPVLAWVVARALREPERVERSSPEPASARMSLPQAMRQILRIPTNRTMIVASALGYFYLTGVRTFAVAYVHRRYGVPEGAASTLLVVLAAGAILGTVVSGRLGDRLLGRGHRAARPALAGAGYLACTVLFGLGLVLGSGSLLVAAPFVFLASAALGGANPPLDAARLDVMAPMLWGRAEGIRTVFRCVLEAPAPILFGQLALALSASTGATATGEGIAGAFLVMLVAPLVAGLLMSLRATRTYPPDVERLAAESDPDPVR